MPAKTIPVGRDATEEEESIVISGISGRFSDCLDINTFRRRILAGECLIRHDSSRWPVGLYNLPTGMGKVPQLEDFDADLFGYSDDQADLMDAQDRIMMTEAHSALLDAGILPEAIRGTRTGYFWGSFVDQVQSALKDDFEAKESIFQHHASRIHEALDLKGPACWLENGCATSLTALHLAVASIRNGLCDQALVGGVNITLDPTKVMWQVDFNTLSHDSTCHVFDEKATGYVKGEGAIVLVVQRRSQAKRVYAEVLGMHCNADGYKADGFTHPGWETQRDLMLAAMRNAGINGADLAYFEAHGTGTQAGDKCELRSIKEAIAVDRSTPLMIGSIKSIAGHAEAASGLVSIAKLIIAYQTRQLAPNIHYEVPNPAIPALTDGTYYVPTEVTTFEGGIVGMNNFGIGGGNASAILNSFPKSRPEDDFQIATAALPRLILLFGRNTKTLAETMAEVEAALPKITREYLALLNDISGYRPEAGMAARGYLLVNSQREVIGRHLQDVFVGGGEGVKSKSKRPLWFIFSGLGCQWPSMARQMMAMRPFANSVHHCIKYLSSLGYDGALMRRFLLEEDPKEIDEEEAQPIVLSIVVVQIALVDTLQALNITPEGIVGHSVGEVAAAYADGCLSREETLQIGLTVEREVFAMRARTPGVMAAVELPFEEALSLRFGTVDVACVNAVDLVTMAGNEADMERLIGLLQGRGIFVQRIATNRLTTHTRFLRNSFERTFMPAFERLQIKGRPRTARFLSTSFEEADWAGSELCRRPGAAYFGRNMLHVVRFYQALRHAPRQALLLEVGPSSQLRSPISRSFRAEEDIRYVGLMRRGGKSAATVDNISHFLTALGQLYAAGQPIQLKVLYPAVSYPVSRHTEFLSPIFRYDHSKPRFVTRYPQYFCPSKATRSVYTEEVSLATHPHFADHAVDGLVLYPGTAYLYLAWRAVASWYAAPDYLAFPVDLRKVNISRATKLSQAAVTTFRCHYFADTGAFTVEANGSVCATGLIFPLDPKFKFIKPVEEPKKNSNSNSETLLLDSESFYRELHVRGYHFGKAFQNVLQIRDDSSAAVVRWTDNVVTYLDAVLQSSVLTQTLRLLYVPTLIESMQIDPRAIQAGLRSSSEFGAEVSKVSDVRLDRACKLIHAAGVQVLNASFKPIARKVEELGNAELVIESHEAIGYDEADGIDRETRATINRYVEDIEQLLNSSPGGEKKPQLSEAQLKAKNCGLWLAVSRADPVALATAAAGSAGRRCPLPPSPVFTTELECDLLHSTFTSDRLFRTQLDVVVENINLYNKLNVLEINTSAQLLYPKLVKIIGRPLFSFNMANLIYSIAHPEVAALPEEITGNHLLTFHPFEVAKSRFPYREMDQQELIIYRDPAVSLDQLATRIDYDMLLRSVETALAPNGFLLAALRESVHPLEALFTPYRSESFHLLLEQFIKFAEEAGLTYVGRKSDGFTACTVLFRKVDHVEVARQKEEVIEISNDNLDWLEVLKAANRNEAVDRIWIHSSDPLSGIVGLTRGLAKDISRNKAKYLFFDQRESGMTLEKALRIARRTQLLQNAFIEDGGKVVLASYRHITFCETPELREGVTDFELRQTKTGDLSSFRPFVKQPLSSLGFEGAIKQDKAAACTIYKLGPEGLSADNPKANQILVEVSKAALNFRDVMIATARMSPADVSDRMAWDDVVLGLEFAGRIAGSGGGGGHQRVMGFANSRAMATSIIANREFLWPVPDEWSLLQAATVPVVYATAYYGLLIRGRLQKGESVLIHAGTGGVGLAAINIALSLGCRLFVTAGTEEKRRFLATTYPAIEKGCIGTTRDTSFETMVLQQTGGRGVDVVLNSLTDDMFWATLRCLADNGRFCEIGKYQFMNDDFMDSSHFLRNKTFHGVHLDRLFPDGGHGALLTPKATRERQQIWRLLNEGIAGGVVQPLPATVFAYQQLEAAFRFMSTGKHIGKVVVDIAGGGEEEKKKKGLLPSPTTSVQAIPKSYFHPAKSYIIAGGLGGMGLELMYWMAERGARRFVLTSRSGVKTPTHKLMIKMVKRMMGCSVVVSTEDGGCESGARVVLKQAESLGPIGGIFLSTLVLENESIDKITAAMYRKVMYAKSTQGLVFDRLLRALPYPVDYFVGFSSIAAGRGFAGQTNYAFANSILERVCEQRRADGLHGLAIQWGMIGDVGYVADHVDVRDSIRGYKPQAIISCWNFMDRAMQTAHSVVGSFIRVEDSMDNLQLKISLLDHVCNIMGIKEKAKLDPKATLGDLGLDSMMAAEIGNVFENEFHMAMTPQEIRRFTIEKISEGFSTS